MPLLPATYQTLLQSIERRIDQPGTRPQILQFVCDQLHQQISYYHWVGFYLTDAEIPDMLVLGPFTGAPTEHVRIPFGRGICGQAAALKKTFLVPDVTCEMNYLACSLEVKSEIVVPIIKNGVVLGELDIDSHQPTAFSMADQQFLEAICQLLVKSVFY